MKLSPWNQAEADRLFESHLPTSTLVGLALTMEVSKSGRNELYGRSHAWYAIASTQLAAIIYMADLSIKTGYEGARRAACIAIAAAGHKAADVIESVS